MAKRKTGHLPGMEPPSYPEIDELAERLSKVRTARIKKNAEEDDLQTELVQKMTENGLKLYEYDGKVVELFNGKTKAKVRSMKGEEEEGKDDEGDKE